MSQKHLRNKGRSIAIVVLMLAAAIQLVAIFVLPFNGYDSSYHLFWIGEWHRLWNAGIFYPRWLPDSFVGFGAPSFYFYPPLTFVLTSAIYAMLPNFSPEAIGKTLGIFAFAVSGFSMWLYLRWRGPGSQTEVASPTMHTTLAPLLGAMLYVFAPYHFFDYSVRGAISEHVALVFVPFVFWGIDLFTERRSARDARRGMGLLILSFALLVLSNLPAATVTGLGAAMYALTRRSPSVTRRSSMRSLAILAGAALAALLLTAFYLSPIVARFGDVQFGRLWHPASVVFSSPFLAIFSGLALLINSYAFLLLAGACILLVGYWRNRKGRTQNGSAVFGMLALIVFVQLPYVSRFLFNFIPPFTIVQLSYRFSILLLFVICILWADEMDTVDDHKTGIPWLRDPASLVVILWSLGSIGLVSLQLANVHVHVNKPLPVGEAPEYAPRWSRPYYDFGVALSAPFANDSQYVVWRGEQQQSFLSDTRQPYSDSITYDSPIAGSLLLRRSYWPTWKASLDGQPTTTEPDSLGRLTIHAPAGQHQVVVSLATENSAKIGTWISAGTLIILCLLWILV